MRCSSSALRAFFVAAAFVVCAVGEVFAEELLYRVQRGDTLIGLGQALLVDPHEWPRLQRLNRVADPYRIPVGTLLRIPLEMLQVDERTAEVEAVAGRASADGQALKPGMQVEGGAELATEDDGYMLLRLPDGSSLVLPAASSARLGRLRSFRGLEGVDVELDLEHGRVESRVPPRRGPAARYRIDTPTAVIGVRGTDFRVATERGGGVSRVEVNEGRVEVGAANSSSTAPVREVDGDFGIVVREGAALPKPVRLLPAPGLAGLPTLFEEPVVRFTLPPLEGAVAWRVRVAPPEPAAAILADVFVESGPARIAGLQDGGYRLLIRGVDADGIEGRDAEHRFRLKARPEPPFLSMPAEAQVLVAGPISFRWAQVGEAVRYRLQVSADDGFSTPLVDDVLDGVSFEVPLPAGRYRWRMASVRADGDAGPWSHPAGFELRPLPVAPEPGAAVSEEHVELRWAGEPGQRYEYQFADDAAFSAVIAQEALDEPAVSLGRPVGGSYWVRVRAMDADGFIGPWSAPQQITVPATLPGWWFLLPLLLL